MLYQAEAPSSDVLYVYIQDCYVFLIDEGIWPKYCKLYCCAILEHYLNIWGKCTVFSLTTFLTHIFNSIKKNVWNGRFQLQNKRLWCSSGPAVVAAVGVCGGAWSRVNVMLLSDVSGDVLWLLCWRSVFLHGSHDNCKTNVCRIGTERMLVTLVKYDNKGCGKKCWMLTCDPLISGMNSYSRRKFK